MRWECIKEALRGGGSAVGGDNPGLKVGEQSRIGIVVVVERESKTKKQEVSDVAENSAENVVDAAGARM